MTATIMNDRIKTRAVFFMFSLFLFTSVVASAQQPADWNGKRAAVVLTYDDALNVHLDNVIPALEARDFKGTFYLTANFPGFLERVDDWKAAAKNGHELGNHTLFHPCEGQRPGREWVNKDYDFTNYSVARIMDEVVLTNLLLKQIDGRTDRTFAYPCGDREAGGNSYVSNLAHHVIAARTVEERIEKRNEIDLFNVGSYLINGHSAEAMIKLVENAQEVGGLVVFLFHGVGGEHGLDVSLAAHDGLLTYLKEHEDSLWITTLADVANYLLAKNKQ